MFAAHIGAGLNHLVNILLSCQNELRIVQITKKKLVLYATRFSSDNNSVNIIFDDQIET